MATRTTPPLRTLGPETFGDRFRRARETSGRSLREAEEAVAQFLPTSRNSLNRLEQLDTAPADRRRRALAYLVLVAYGFDPLDFGLADTDLPAGLSLDSVVERIADSLAVRTSACITADRFERFRPLYVGSAPHRCRRSVRAETRCVN